MDQGKEEVSKSLERSNNSKKKKTSDDQKEKLNNQMEQKAGKRFKTTHYPLRLKLKAGSELSKEEALLLSGSDEEQAEGGHEDDEATDSEETDSEEIDSEETDSEEIDSEETETEEEPSVISPAGSSMNKPKGMTTTKKIIRELKKKSNSLSDTCTSTFRPYYPTDKFPDSDKDESKRSPPVEQQGSSCKKNL